MLSAFMKHPLKKTRELYAGQGMFGDPSSTWTTRGALKKQFGKLSKTHAIKTYRHHMTHAAAGFPTSPI